MLVADVEAEAPQAPQFLELDARSTQRPEQFVSCGPHCGIEHVPFTHASSMAHAFPQVPQLALLVARSAQMAPHGVVGAGHAGVGKASR